jgi:NADPH:quinone reductase-like Zn-dependent oxidoreductase
VKALTFTRYGGPEVLKIVDVPCPVPKDNQVLVRVKAVSLNEKDYAMVTGMPYINRIVAGNFLRPKNCIPGSDIAGIVEKVGRNVVRFHKGDRVFGDLSGSESYGGCAEYVCAGEDELALIGENLNFEESASLPHAGMLAVQALIDSGNLKEGQSLLINGAGGGFGTIAIQIALALRVASTTGVDHGDKADLMKSLGFNRVLDYTKENFLDDSHQYDLILDTKTSFPFRRYRTLLKKGGRYVTVGGDPGRLMRLTTFSPLISFLLKREFYIVLLKANRDLEYLKDLHTKGFLRPILDGHWSFDRIIDAFEYYSRGLQRGKIVISF